MRKLRPARTLDPFPSDPIQNHIKVKDVGKELHQIVRDQLERWYSAVPVNGEHQWHAEKLGPPVRVDGPYHIWGGQDWKAVIKNCDGGLSFEVRTYMDTDGVLRAW